MPKKLNTKLIIFICFSGIFFSSLAWGASEESRQFLMAQKAAKAGQADFAFMHYRNLLSNYPNSKYRETALFAEGEYYFMLSSCAASFLDWAIFNK